MSEDYNVQNATSVSVGTPPDGFDFDEWKSFHVHFHGFAGLSTTRNELFESPKFACFGRQWVVELYPGGCEEGSIVAEDGMVSVFLKHCSEGRVTLNYCFIAKNSNGKEIAHWISEEEEFGPFGVEGVVCCLGEESFAKRSEILDALEDDGTLTIEVRMRHVEATGTPVTPFIPENPLCKQILGKLMDEKSADVLFEVGRDKTTKGKKRAKNSPALFHAHSFILRVASDTFAELCRSGKELSPIQINDVKPEIFRHMLHYVYGGKVKDEDMEANAKDIIDAADRYGVVNLKLEAEASYTKSLELSVDNVIDNLLYADAKNCALLKEVVMDFMVGNGDDILGKVSFDNVPGSVVSDLLTSMTRREKKDDDSSSNFNTMRVSTLRKKLHEKGLEIDGSREAMIALLKGNS